MSGYSISRMGLTLQDKDKDSQTESCTTMKDSLQVTERSVGVFSACMCVTMNVCVLMIMLGCCRCYYMLYFVVLLSQEQA